MWRETEDNVLMVILGIAFFLNIIVMNLFPPTIEELVLVGYTILGIGALFFVLSVFTLRRKGPIMSLIAEFTVLFGIQCI